MLKNLNYFLLSRTIVSGGILSLMMLMGDVLFLGPITVFSLILLSTIIGIFHWRMNLWLSKTKCLVLKERLHRRITKESFDYSALGNAMVFSSALLLGYYPIAILCIINIIFIYLGRSTLNEDNL